MNKGISPFRLVITLVFAALLLGGVIAFSTYRGTDSGDEVGRVTIWGTYDSVIFNDYLEYARQQYPEIVGASYVEFSNDTFEKDVLEALASGQSPDLLFIDDTKLLGYLNKVITIESEAYTKQQFQDQFVELAEVYFQNEGIVGIPLAADPLVMFWNRDIFASEGLARPPSAWPDFFGLANSLTIVDDSLNIRRSAIAFGETVNVNNIREILATLMFQVGNPVVEYDNRGQLIATLEGGRNIESAFPVLRFFTEFSDASKSVYSWNRSLPQAQEAFLSERLAVYFGLASEILPMRLKNPNLNFAVAEIPTVDDDVSRRKAVYAKLYGFVIPRASNNPNGAFIAMQRLTESEPMRFFAEQTNLAPVRRDLAVEPSKEAFQDVLKKQTIYAQTFLDPDETKTTRIFSDMIGYITSGQRSVDDAIFVSNAELQDVLDQ